MENENDVIKSLEEINAQDRYNKIIFEYIAGNHPNPVYVNGIGYGTGIPTDHIKTYVDQLLERQILIVADKKAEDNWSSSRKMYKINPDHLDAISKWFTPRKND
jgi:predicted transcriptional regulator